MHKNRIGRARIVLVLALGALLPFGVNCLYFVNTTAFHHLEIYSFFYLYVACFMIYDMCPPLKLADTRLTRRARAWLSKNSLREKLWAHRVWLFCLIPAVLVLNNIIYANQVYTKKDLIYQQTLSVMTRVVYRMEETEGYVPGETPVVFVGDIRSNNLLIAARPNLQYLKGVGIYSLSITYFRTMQWYFEHVLATPANFADDETTAEYEEKPEVQNMPAYPDQEAFQMIDGVLVCKLSE